MRSYISEFSYGYALTEALIYDSGTPVTASPVFPSLIEEGRAGGGYDVRLDFPGLPLFLQFKLSDYMKGRSNTNEIRLGLFCNSFYRMHLRSQKRSKQHQLLLDWETKGNQVYYAAPIFHEQQQLNEAYINRKILQKSVFFKPSQIGTLPDDDEHHIAFQFPGKAYLLSAPQEIQPPLNFELISEQLIDGLFRVSDSNLRDLSERLLPQLMNFYNTHKYGLMVNASEADQAIESLRDPLRRIALLSKILFDSSFYVVQKQNQGED